MADRLEKFQRTTGLTGVIGIFDALYTRRSRDEQPEQMWGVIGATIVLVDELRRVADRVVWKHNPALPPGSVTVALTDDEVIVTSRNKVRVRYPIAEAFGLASYRSAKLTWIEIGGDRFWTSGYDHDIALRLRRRVLDATSPA